MTLRLFFTLLLAALWLAPNAVLGATNGAYRGHQGEVICIVFAPDSRHALSGGKDGVVRYFDSRTWREVHQWNSHKGPIHALAFSPDGKQCLSAGNDGTLKVYRLDNGNEVTTFHLKRTAIHAALFLANGSQLLAGAEDGSIHRWDLETQMELSVWQGHDAAVKKLAVSRDQNLVFSLDERGIGLTWEVATGKRLRSLPELKNQYTFQGSLQPKGHYVATVTLNDSFSKFRRNSSQVLGAFSLEGRRLVRVERCHIELRGQYWYPGRPPVLRSPGSPPIPKSKGGLGEALAGIFTLGLVPILDSISRQGEAPSWDLGEMPRWIPIDRILKGYQFQFEDPKTGRMVHRFFGNPGAAISVVHFADEEKRLVFGCTDGSAWISYLPTQKHVSYRPSKANSAFPALNSRDFLPNERRYRGGP